MFNTLNVDDVTNQETAQHLYLVNNVYFVRKQISFCQYVLEQQALLSSKQAVKKHSNKN